MHFTKMHGLGNDYLYVYGDVPENAAALSVRLSNRHFGAGSDGMIYISPSDVADFKMRIFNADGSEAAMCGNGIRCVGKYVYDKGYTRKTALTIDTLSGIKRLELLIKDDAVETVSVNMGCVQVFEDRTLTVHGNGVTVTPVSVGNPHAVIFVGDAEAAPLTTTGPGLEQHPAFPDGVNVEFVEVLSRDSLRMRVWERGSGVTMACGTGACASVAAAIQKGYCGYDSPVLIHLDGGVLEVVISPDHTVIIRGPAELVYEGEVIL